MTKTYEIRGTDAVGNPETFVLVPETKVVGAVREMAEELLKGWDKFTIDVEVCDE